MSIIIIIPENGIYALWRVKASYYTKRRFRTAEIH